MDRTAIDPTTHVRGKTLCFASDLHNLKIDAVMHTVRGSFYKLLENY